jgi:hypothetical protein
MIKAAYWTLVQQVSGENRGGSAEVNSRKWLIGTMKWLNLRTSQFVLNWSKAESRKIQRPFARGTVKLHQCTTHAATYIGFVSALAAP